MEGVMDHGYGEDPVNEKAYRRNQAETEAKQAMNMAPESHMVYELRQRMQYHINKIMEIQKAIDAVNTITY